MAASEKKASLEKGKLIGLFAGLAVAVIIYFLPIAELPNEGRRALALTLMTIIFWATNVAQNGFIAALYLGLVLITETSTADVVFKGWTQSPIWMIIASFLFAAAIQNSGLADRIANAITIKFVRSWTSLLLTVVLLQLVLSIFIPNCFPRCFLILAIVKSICSLAGLDEHDTKIAGFFVFAIALPTLLVFLTGEATTNMMALGFADATLGWGKWLIIEGVPALISTVLTTVLFMFLFKPTSEFQSLDKEEMIRQQQAKGPISGTEKKMLIWLIIFVAFWLGSGFIHIDISYGTLVLVVLLTLPVFGSLITPKDWSSIPLNLLIFLTGAMAIGSVGKATGMNAWIAQTLMPASLSSNPFIIAAFVTIMAMVLHLFLGSIITCMAIAMPILVSFTANTGINPIAIALLVYNALTLHYIFPFHELTLTAGCDPVGYSNKECIKLGLPLTIVVLLVNVFVCVPWWKALGFLAG